jgi:hypothetical protein
VVNEPPNEIQAAGQGIYSISENSHGRIITGMISPDAQAAGLLAIREHEGRGIVRVIDGTPTLITSPLLIRRIRAEDFFQMVLSVGAVAAFVTAGLAVLHVKPLSGFVIGVAVGLIAWFWYVYALRPRPVWGSPMGDRLKTVSVYLRGRQRR